jgi:tetratricopeptide (TPR) repeat protein
MEAQILRNLGWLCVWQSDPVRGEEYLWQSATIYHEIGEPGIQANALGGLGRLYREHMGDFGRAKACGEEARRLSREAGDFFNEAIGEFNIGFALHYQGDYGAADVHMQRGVHIMSDKTGSVGSLALCRVGVALNAIALGDFAAAASYLELSRHMFRKIGRNDLDDDAWAQSTLALLKHQMGDDRTARDYASHATAIHRRTGYDYRTATDLTRLGHALAALGETHEAAAAYQEALDLRREMGQRHLAPEPLAGLARVALGQENPKRALAYVHEILCHLATGGPSTGSGCNIDGTDEPLRIYLTCYHVLHTNTDPRADEILQAAHSLLQERAAKIDDEELRRSYRENVTAHREIVELFSIRNQSTMA